MPAPAIQILLPQAREVTKAESLLQANGISDPKVLTAAIKLNKELGCSDDELHPQLPNWVKGIKAETCERISKLSSWIESRKELNLCRPDNGLIEEAIKIMDLSSSAYAIRELERIEESRVKNGGKALNLSELKTISAYGKKTRRLLTQLAAIQTHIAYKPEGVKEVSKDAVFIRHHNFAAEQMRVSIEGAKLKELCELLDRTDEPEAQSSVLDELAVVKYLLHTAGYKGTAYNNIFSALNKSSSSSHLTMRTFNCLIESRRRCGENISDPDLLAVANIVEKSIDGRYVADNLDLLTEAICQKAELQKQSLSTAELAEWGKQIQSISSDFFYGRKAEAYIRFTRTRSEREAGELLNPKDLQVMAAFKMMKDWPARCSAYDDFIKVIPEIQKQMDEDNQGCLTSERLAGLVAVGLSHAMFFTSGNAFTPMLHECVKYVQGRKEFPTTSEFSELATVAAGHSSGVDFIECLTLLRKNNLFNNERPSQEFLQAFIGYYSSGVDYDEDLTKLLKQPANLTVKEAELAQHITEYTELLASLSQEHKIALLKRTPEVVTLLAGEDRLQNVTYVLRQIAETALKNNVAIADLRLAVQE